jgi:hypothetical protein
MSQDLATVPRETERPHDERRLRTTRAALVATPA